MTDVSPTGGCRGHNGEAPTLLLLKFLAATPQGTPKLHVRETTREDLRPHEERTPTICLQQHLLPETLTTESLGDTHGLNRILWRKTCWGPNPPGPQKVTLFSDRAFTDDVKLQ